MGSGRGKQRRTVSTARGGFQHVIASRCPDFPDSVEQLLEATALYKEDEGGAVYEYLISVFLTGDESRICVIHASGPREGKLQARLDGDYRIASLNDDPTPLHEKIMSLFAKQSLEGWLMKDDNTLAPSEIEAILSASSMITEAMMRKTVSDELRVQNF